MAMRVSTKTNTIYSAENADVYGGTVPLSQAIHEAMVEISGEETSMRGAGAVRPGYTRLYTDFTASEAETLTIGDRRAVFSKKSSATPNHVFQILNNMSLPSGGYPGGMGDRRARQNWVRNQLPFVGALQTKRLAPKLANMHSLPGRANGSAVRGGAYGVHNPHNKPIPQFATIVWDVPDPHDTKRGPVDHVMNTFFGPSSIAPFFREYDPNIAEDANFIVGTAEKAFVPKGNYMLSLKLSNNF